MPCGCFGKKKNEKGGFQKVPPSDFNAGSVITPGEKKPYRPPEESNQNDKRRDGVESPNDYGKENCAPLGFQPTGSRPPSSQVDSPLNDSHAHTPSTIPAAPSSVSSGGSSGASSPLDGRREGASSRAQLAEKRREFFIELLPPGSSSSPSSLTSTLPTPARARQFGKVRSTRPLSQPTPSDPGGREQEEAEGPPAPPGPHLLRHVQIPPKEPREGGGFESPEFLLELKNASEEISRRWAMPEDELRVREVPLREGSPPGGSGGQGQWGGVSPVDRGPSAVDTSREVGLSTTEVVDLVDVSYSKEADIRTSSEEVGSASGSFTEKRDHADAHVSSPPVDIYVPFDPSSGVPETLVTPPSPLSGDEPVLPSSFGPPEEEEEEEELDSSALREIADLENDSFDLSDERLDEGHMDPYPPEPGDRRGDAPPVTSSDAEKDDFKERKRSSLSEDDDEDDALSDPAHRSSKMTSK